MINRLAFPKTQSFLTVLKYTDIRSYTFTVAFISLAVATPWVFHQFHLAGPTFLPMHIFILVAGLLFGWRAGLMVGLFTPLASYAISGMPAIKVLPQIVVEISVYGLAAGILREKFNLRVIWSLIGAMIAGRLSLLLTVVIIQFISREIYSPLGLQANPLAVLWSMIALGWPGIVIQLAFILPIIKLVEKFLDKSGTARKRK